MKTVKFILFIFIFSCIIYNAAADVRLYDTNVQSTHGASSYKFEVTNAYTNMENWTLIPYGTTEHTWVGDALIETDEYRLLFFASWPEYATNGSRPSFYGRGEHEPFGNEIYASWDYPDANKQIWNVYVDINDAITINNNTETNVTITTTCGSYNDIFPGWNVVTYSARPINLEVIPRNSLEDQVEGSWYNDRDHTYRLAAHSATDRLGAAIPLNLSQNDHVVDDNEYDLDFGENDYSYADSPDYGHMAIYQTAVYHAATQHTIYTVIPNNQTDRITFHLQGRGSPSSSYGSLESIGFNAQEGETVSSGFFGSMNIQTTYMEEDADQSLSQDETWTSTDYEIGEGTPGPTGDYIPPGQWRVSGRLNVGGTKTTYTHNQSTGFFNFTAPEAGTLELVSAYLFYRTEDTPSSTLTVMDMYNDAVNASYEIEPDYLDNPNISFSNILKESDTSACFQSYDSGSSSCLHYTFINIGNVSYAGYYRSLLHYNGTFNDTHLHHINFTKMWNYTSRTNDAHVELYAVPVDWETSYTTFMDNSSSTQWANAGGDWVDSEGTPQGNVPYDTFVMPVGDPVGTVYQANVTELVNDYNESVRILLKLNDTNETQDNCVVSLHSFGAENSSWIPYINSTPSAGEPPEITSWGNDFTNNDSLDIEINKTGTTMFNITTDIGYDEAFWFLDGVRQTGYTGDTINLTNLSADSYELSVYVYKASPEGTSNTITWTITTLPLLNQNTPDAVVNLTSTVGNTWVNVSWEDGGGVNATDWYVAYDLESGLLYNGTDTYFNHTNLSTRTTKEYIVRAVNDTDGYLAYSSDSYVTNHTRYAYVEYSYDEFYNISAYAGANFTIRVRVRDNDNDVYSDWTEQTVLLEGNTPNPTNLQNDTGNFWVNYTWSGSSESFNVSQNGTWINGTTTAYNNSTVGPHGYSNIIVYGYNASTGLSLENITDNVTVPNNAISISNVSSSYNIDEGDTLYIDANYADADGDTPTFADNSSEWNVNSGTGVVSWVTGDGDDGVYYWYINVSDGYGSTDTQEFSVTVANTLGLENIPPDPVSLSDSTGNFWVNYTWSPGSGNVTDSYNISQNSTWTNESTSTYFYNNVGPHGYSDITVYAYNNSGAGSLSAGYVTDNVTVPNNAVTITSTSDWSGDEGDTVNVDFDRSDADGDTPTFSCNRTDLFADFSTSTGTGSWLTDTNGTFYVDFGVADGYGSTDNYTMTITVYEVFIPLAFSSYNNSVSDDLFPHQQVAANIAFNVTPNKVVTEYTWIVDGVDVGNDFDNYTTSWSASGFKNITVFATDGNETTSLTFYPWVEQQMAGAGDVLDEINTTAYDSIITIISEDDPDYEEFLHTLTMPHTSIIGSLFYVLLYGVPFIFIWISQGSAKIPAALGCMLAPIILGAFNPDYVPISILFILLTLFGIAYTMYKERGS